METPKEAAFDDVQQPGNPKLFLKFYRSQNGVCY